MEEIRPASQPQPDASAPALRVHVLPETWTDLLPMLLNLLQNGRGPAREMAISQLKRMAAAADVGNRAFEALARHAGVELKDSAESAQVLRDVEALRAARSS
jgi:hypothetical protein